MAITASNTKIDGAISAGDVWRYRLAVREVRGGGVSDGHPNEVGPTICMMKREGQYVTVSIYAIPQFIAP